MGAVYILVKSLLLRLINDCDEGTASVAGDGERKKWVYLELGQSGESEKEQSFMLWGGGRGGIPVCSVRG